MARFSSLPWQQASSVGNRWHERLGSLKYSNGRLQSCCKTVGMCPDCNIICNNITAYRWWGEGDRVGACLVYTCSGYLGCESLNWDPKTLLLSPPLLELLIFSSEQLQYTLRLSTVVKVWEGNMAWMPALKTLNFYRLWLTGEYHQDTEGWDLRQTGQSSLPILS